MAYYPPSPSPPREDPIVRIIRELINLSNKVDQLSRDLANVSSGVNGLESRISNIEKAVSEVIKAQNLISGATPQSMEELTRTLSNTLSALTRIEASLITYKDSIASLNNKIEDSVNLLAKVSTDIKEYKTLDINRSVELNNQLANVATRLNEIQKLIEEESMALISEYRRNSEIMEGLKSIILDLLDRGSIKS
ncbi:MAG: hypothetical protein TU36_005760 [Vulcanisaeta sp. AZ3]|nr:MAG: hypothetical protein TU36_07485 [Vulcanisaeta sp. AZ3]